MAELNNTSTGQWSEIDANNVSASPDGWPSGTFPNQVEPIGRSTMGAIKRYWDRINGTVTSTGSANAYVYTPSNASYPTAYVQGEIYSFLANFANTGAATLNINGLGVKNLFKPTPTGIAALVGGEVQTGQMVMVVYDGTQFQIISETPPAIATSVGPGGAFKNLQSAWLSNSTYSITAGEILLEDSNLNIFRATSVNLTLNTATSGAGGLDVGSLAASAAYSIWIIYNGTTVSSLMSLSATSPTMPTGYTYKARVGWINLDSAKNIMGQQSWGRIFQFKVGANLNAMPYLSNGAIGGESNYVATTALVPVTASQIHVFAQSGSSSANFLALAPNPNYSTTLSTINPAPISTPASGGVFAFNSWMGLETPQIVYVCAQANSQSYIVGWEDNF